MGRRAPGGLLSLWICCDALHDVDAPAEIGHVRRMGGAAGELLPLLRPEIVDVVRTRQDVEIEDLADRRGVARPRECANVSPPFQERTRPSDELLERGRVGIGVDLISGLAWQGVDHILDSPHPSRVVDSGFMFSSNSQFFSPGYLA